MKKKLRLLLLFLLFLVPTIKAETLTESTNNYITQMNEMTINVKAKMNSLNSWMQDYKDEVVAVLDQNLMDSLLNEISSENYAGSIELLIDALTDANYLEAANKLDQIDLGNSIADYLELEENLVKFINDNSSSLNIIDGTEEGVDCLFNLYDAMNASYDELKTSITNNFEKLSTLLGSVFEKYLDKIKTISNQELAEIFAEYKDYLGFIDEMVTKYNQAFTKYEDVLKKVIGNVHSGWRGTLDTIILNAVNLMVERYNSNKEDIICCFNPSILGCHFEIGNDVYSMFKEKFNYIDEFLCDKKIVNGEEKYYLDLLKFNIDLLKRNGIKNIYASDICSYCDTICHSYRRDKTKKRNGSFITM